MRVLQVGNCELHNGSLCTSWFLCVHMEHALYELVCVVGYIVVCVCVCVERVLYHSSTHLYFPLHSVPLPVNQRKTLCRGARLDGGEDSVREMKG